MELYRLGAVAVGADEGALGEVLDADAVLDGWGFGHDGPPVAWSVGVRERWFSLPACSGRAEGGGLAHNEAQRLIMATSTLISVAEYLSTSYRPDCDYVDGEVQERNLGEYDHANIQAFSIEFSAWQADGMAHPCGAGDRGCR